jgi:hypothetical protein
METKQGNLPNYQNLKNKRGGSYEGIQRENTENPKTQQQRQQIK